MCGQGNYSKANQQHFQGSPISDEALDTLKSFNWPGNIRQLENEIERSAIFASNNIIQKNILSPEIVNYIGSYDDAPIEYGLGLNEIKKKHIEKLEKRLIFEGLEKSNWNKTECAKLLKVSRGDLMRKISKYKISPNT